MAHPNSIQHDKAHHATKIGICLLILVGIVGDAVGYKIAIGFVLFVFALILAVAKILPRLLREQHHD